MTRQRIEKLLAMARTSGALTSSADIKDETIMPPALREQCLARAKELEDTIERILIEEL